jgi:glucose/arabinose dehydrogenase
MKSGIVCEDELSIARWRDGSDVVPTFPAAAPPRGWQSHEEGPAREQELPRERACSAAWFQASKFVAVGMTLLALHSAFSAEKTDTKLAAAKKAEKKAEQAALATESEPGLINDYYRVESIATPPGLSAECGGLAFMPDGRLVACFHRGEVYTYDPKKKAWKLFAEGLHDPLGVVAESDSSIVVMQRPELTRIRDTNGDGVADSYETICDSFGMTGNYHEFAFGPVLDKDGNFLVALNCGSAGSGIRYELRGKYNPLSRAGRMYSCVPWRGWVVKIAPDGTLTPWASGFRSPDGLGFDADWNLFVSDNQGDWLGACPIYHVRQGKFYGHPASLAWREGNTRAPLRIPIAELDNMRERPNIIFPYNLQSNSPTQPLFDATGGRFGPFAGQMFIGEMNRPRILRVMLERVDGQFQGASVPLVENGRLRAGNNRLAFAPDNSLWVGQTDHGWAGAKGIQRITWTGKMPLEVLKMNLTHSGFDITFTRPVEAEGASKFSAYKFKRYYYEYHAAYGSPQFDTKEVPVKSVTLSADRKRVSIGLDELVAWRVYELHLDGIKGDDGTPLVNPIVAYTLNHLLENTPAPPPPGAGAANVQTGEGEVVVSRP